MPDTRAPEQCPGQDALAAGNVTGTNRKVEAAGCRTRSTRTRTMGRAHLERTGYSLDGAGINLSNWRSYARAGRPGVIS